MQTVKPARNMTYYFFIVIFHIACQIMTHLLVVYPVVTNEEMTTKSQRYNYFTRNGGNAVPKHAGAVAKGSNPTAGLTPLWARNPLRGNFNHWQVSWKEAGQR